MHTHVRTYTYTYSRCLGAARRLSARHFKEATTQAQTGIGRQQSVADQSCSTVRDPGARKRRCRKGHQHSGGPGDTHGQVINAREFAT